MTRSRQRDKEIRKASEEIRTTLAENVLRSRHAKGISQEGLADMCGLHRTYIGSIERRERNVTLSTLEVISDTLGVSVPQLLTKKDEEP
ncbi:helix-turn-helix domain-containing protein [Yoonia sp. R2-816]|uniref:helix-turn-helix domain-containing protein n=1 Tax=Yoonia sp. R2-816 TaxID=3342638 RepID=UPI00372BCF44